MQLILKNLKTKICYRDTENCMDLFDYHQDHFHHDAFKILPKLHNYAKSGHTDYKSNVVHNVHRDFLTLATDLHSFKLNILPVLYLKGFYISH